MRGGLAGALLLVALLLAGCGGGGSSAPSNGEASKPAERVLADAVRAAKSASSYHMSGQGGSASHQFALDLTVVSGEGATGSVTLNGEKVDMVIIGTWIYVKGDMAYWTQFGPAGSVLAQTAAGKWVKLPGDNSHFGPVTGFANARTFFDKLATDHGKLVKRGATEFDGQKVVAIDDTTQGGTLYVSATGTPYVVGFSGSAAGGTASASFDNWNKSVTLGAPYGAIDVSSLIP